jgi:TRAP-type mannitol/chloroaromatic compound transport system permease small subunit
MPMKLNLFISGLLLLLQIIVLGLLCWFTWRAAIFSFNRDEVSIGLVEISLWPHRFMIATGLTVLTFQSVVSGLDLLLNGKHPFAPDQAIELAQAVRQQTL